MNSISCGTQSRHLRSDEGMIESDHTYHIPVASVPAIDISDQETGFKAQYKVSGKRPYPDECVENKQNDSSTTLSSIARSSQETDSNECPSSPLSSATEMLTMLQSLPKNLKTPHSLKGEIVPSLSPVPCRSPPPKRTSPFHIGVSRMCNSQDITPCSKRIQISEFYPSGFSEINSQNSEVALVSKSDIILKESNKCSELQMVSLDDKIIIAGSYNDQDNVVKYLSENIEISKSDVILIDMNESSNVPVPSSIATLQTTVSRPDKVLENSAEYSNKNLPLKNHLCHSVGSVSASLGSKQKQSKTKSASRDKMTQTRVPLLGKMTQTSDVDFPPSQHEQRVACLEVKRPLPNLQGLNHLAETEKLKTENLKLNNENAQLQKTIQDSKTKLQEFDTRICTLLRREKELFEDLQLTKTRLCWKGLSDSSSRIKFYTGLPDAATFEWILGLCTQNPISYHCKWRVSTLPPSDQLLMSLMRLRLNLDRRLLSDWFDISVATVSNVERTWISLLHRELFMELFMDPLSPNRRNFPQFFPEETKPRCFYGFVEIDIDHQFDKTEAVKGVLGVTSNGSIFSASKLYADLTENAIIQESGLTETLDEGDFLLEGGECLSSEYLCGEQYPDYCPPSAQVFNKGKILVEKALCKIKEYSVIEHIPVAMAPVASEVWQVCVTLTSICRSVCQNKTVEDSS